MLFILKERVESANYLKVFFYHTTVDDNMQFGQMASPPSHLRSYEVKYEFC